MKPKIYASYLWFSLPSMIGIFVFPIILSSRFVCWKVDLLKSGSLLSVFLDFVHIIFVVREYGFAGVDPYAREHSLLTICTS